VHIKKMISQNRRDFAAIFQCEHCKFEDRGVGYDDINFHQNVIPNMFCLNCDKIASSSYTPLTPKYSEDTVI
jgi:hypothetical protein